MQISKKFLQTGVPLALFLAVSVTAVSSAKAGADYGIEEDSNAAHAAPTKLLERTHPDYHILSIYAASDTPTEDHLKAYLTLKILLKDNKLFFPNEIYFRHVFAAQKAGIELQTKDHLFAYNDTKSWLKGKAPTQAQFKTMLILKELLKGTAVSPNETYFKYMLESQEAGIELQTKDDILGYGKAKIALEAAPTFLQFEAYKKLKKDEPYINDNLLKNKLNQRAATLEKPAGV
ncbi:MAG: hypothetical protein ACRC4G_02175 [Alphaproteobacteria bacterium]